MGELLNEECRDIVFKFRSVRKPDRKILNEIVFRPHAHARVGLGSQFVRWC